MKAVLFALVASCLSLGLQAESEFERTKRLAEGGNAIEQFNLGMAYLAKAKKGLNAEHFFANASKWLTKSAEQGNQYSEAALGALYHYGKGVPKDRELAIFWYTRSAKQGNQVAQYELGEIYRFDPPGIPSASLVALKWFTKSALQGYPKAQKRLGEIYQHGDGVSVNNKLAFKWYLLAAEQGDASSQKAISSFYFSGTGTPQDYISAHAWANVSKANGGGEGAQGLFGMIEFRMTPEQIAVAQALAKKIFQRIENKDSDNPINQRVD
jgi:uncharacterized protein